MALTDILILGLIVNLISEVLILAVLGTIGYSLFKRNRIEFELTSRRLRNHVSKLSVMEQLTHYISWFIPFLLLYTMLYRMYILYRTNFDYTLYIYHFTKE